VVVAPLLAFVSTIVFAVVTMMVEAEHPEWLLAASHLALVWGGLTFLAIVLRRNPAGFVPALPLALVCLGAVDGLLGCHFSEGTLYNYGTRPDLPLPASSSIEMGPASFRRALGSGRANINFFFKVPTLHNYAPFKNRFHEAIATNPNLARMALGEQRTWFAPDAPEVALTEAAFDQFTERVTEVNAPIIVIHSREALLNPSATSVINNVSLATAPAALNIPAKILEYTPDSLALEVTAPNEGWLMITDRWSRSWGAKVNGTPQPVAGANFVFRAVRVMKGDNRIEFNFHPMGLPQLIAVSWSTLALILALSIIAPWWMRRDAREPALLG